MKTQSVAFVLSHPLPSISGEIRELVIAKALAASGMRVKVLRPARIPKPRQELLDHGLQISYWPVDNVGVLPQDMVSTQLLAALATDEPDLVVVKGIGYEIARSVVHAVSASTKIAVIIGGSTTDPKWDSHRVDAWFFEYDEQSSGLTQHLSPTATVHTLPKYIDWDLVGTRSNEEKQYDIVSVGDLIKRKNHRALFPLFKKHSVAIVGGQGPEKDEVEAEAALHPHVDLVVGDQALVFQILRKSRIMVHPSLWDGFPRAIAEALAVGLPVIACSSTVKGGFENGKEGYLVPADQLVPAAEALLADPAKIREMGDHARTFAARTYSVDNIVRVFKTGIDLIPN